MAAHYIRALSHFNTNIIDPQLCILFLKYSIFFVKVRKKDFFPQIKFSIQGRVLHWDKYITYNFTPNEMYVINEPVFLDRI
jgi:hypothetical protein